ncbi:hypothetical protein EQV77_03285 [Halobacillus fulvus]|nr:hypothetical protein EQV77_03285 [Halobacillus fulvus]
MFPGGQPPFPPMGGYTGFQPYGAPQGMMRSFSPMLRNGPGALRNSVGAGLQRGGLPFIGGSNFGSQAAGAVAKTGGAGWIGHVQTALKAMQSAAPMIQQYGPMMKNIPAMINMMKIMNEPDDEEGSPQFLDESSSFLKESSRRTKESVSSSSSSSRHQGTSQPRLYI